MTSLREQFLEAVKARQQDRQKILVAKSPSAPPIACIRNKATGEIMGFGPVERVPPDEVARLAKMEVSKSAGDDPNTIFDDLFDFGPQLQSIGADVSKSAELDDDENSELAGLFPLFLQPS